jgi:hypothetical protein
MMLHMDPTLPYMVQHNVYEPRPCGGRPLRDESWKNTYATLEEAKAGADSVWDPDDAYVSQEILFSEKRRKWTRQDSGEWLGPIPPDDGAEQSGGWV